MNHVLLRHKGPLDSDVYADIVAPCGLWRPRSVIVSERNFGRRRGCLGRENCDGIEDGRSGRGGIRKDSYRIERVRCNSREGSTDEESCKV